MSKISNNQLKQLYKDFGSSQNGLSSTQVSENKIKYGSNELEKSKKESFFHKFLMQFKNVMIIMLLASAFISLVVSISNGNYSDLFESFLILGIVVINALVGALQERKAENTLALLEKQTITSSKVIRDGNQCFVPITDIVVGDLIELKNGDIVPADIILIETNNFSCNESSLTGESAKSKKDASHKSAKSSLLSDRKDMCFKGTVVTSGNAQGIVVATGKLTELGKIAGLISTKSKQKTPLEQNIDKIGKVISLAVLTIVVVVFLVQLIFSKSISIGDAFMTAIALAVAAIPESLPAVITIIMALGVQKLAKRGAIVKTLSSVETLGCCDCICTDKTGTLTQNQMSVVNIFSQNKVLTTSEFEKNKQLLEPTLMISTLCSNAKFGSNGNIVGDATEKALLSLCKSMNFDIDQTRNKYKRTSEIPFDSITKKMITVHQYENLQVALLKGAPDILISKCTQIILDGKIVPLSQKSKDKIQKVNELFTSEAKRVLLLAAKPQDNQNQNIENGFIFVSLIALVDPPRPEAKTAIEKCHKAGMKPVMITGDHKTTAFAIAKELGIAKKQTEVISGFELDNIDDKMLQKVINNYSVFARVTPEHKSRIVECLKKNGRVVAMTGDGVNDAPSIKKANIGVCMGDGTDVTKSVSDLIVTDNNFSTIVVAVEEGRTIYNNIQKTIQFLISTNAVEVLGLFVTSIIMQNSVFLTASQILFINLITDSLPAFALGIEPTEKNILDNAPRNTKDPLFSGEIGTAIIYQAFVQTFVVLILFVFTYHIYGNDTANTMTFLTICLMQILHAINCKTNRSIFSINIFSNKVFNLSFVALFALIMIVGLVPSIGVMFGLVPLSAYQWLIVSLCSISIIPLVELCKFFLNTKKHKKFI